MVSRKKNQKKNSGTHTCVSGPVRTGAGFRKNYIFSFQLPADGYDAYKKMSGGQRLTEIKINYSGGYQYEYQ